MTDKTKKTIEKLKAKAKSSPYDGSKAIMPSITAIASMLDDLGIPYDMRDSSNTVERRTKGCRYVNSRHTGKQGKLITLKDADGSHMSLDTSDSYYSHNTWGYASKLFNLAKKAELNDH